MAARQPALPNSASSARASRKSAVSKPSVNQPYMSASNVRASSRRPCACHSRLRLMATLTEVEVRSALQRLVREGSLDTTQAQSLTQHRKALTLETKPHPRPARRLPITQTYPSKACLVVRQRLCYPRWCAVSLATQKENVWGDTPPMPW